MALAGASEPVAGERAATAVTGERAAQCERRENRGRACGRHHGSDAEGRGKAASRLRDPTARR
jgi:hypothetical protein